MQPDRPVRLTFPAREPGARRIMAGKLQVGHALADHRMRWTGYLWAVADRPGYGFRGEVKAGNLSALREQVGGWLESGGPWWAAEHPDGIERDGLCEVLGDEERSDEMGPAATCPVAFVPRDPEYCPRCTCDQPAGHQGHHHCPDCEVWYTLASDVERAS